MYDFTEKQGAVPRLPLYDRTVRADAKFSQKSSARVLQDCEEYTCRARDLHEQGGGCFSKLTVSDLFPPFVQRCLSRVFIGNGCDVSDSDLLMALAKHRGGNV